MLLLLSCLITLIIILIPRLIKWYQTYYFLDAFKIPGPPATLIFGNVLDLGFDMKETFQKFVEMRVKYGSLFGLWMTSFNYRIVLSDPVYAEKIFTSNVHLNKGNSYAAFDPILGNGLLNAEIPRWKHDRKILAQTFHVKLLAEFVETFSAISNALVENLKRRSINGQIDVYSTVKSYALDAMCETMMDVSISAQQNEYKEFIHALEVHFDKIILKFFSIAKRCDLYYRFTNDYKAEKESLKIMQEFVKLLIRNREVIRKSAKNKSRNEEFDQKRKTPLLDLLLDLKDDGVYTEQDVLDHTVTFFLAGVHTNTSAISFLFYEISKHPDIQRRVLEEVHSIVGNDNNENITFDDMQKMQFTECVVKESLRMYPPAAFFERSIENDITMGDYRISKNTNILFFPYGAHHDEKLFPNPEQFDPDRFSNERINEIHPYAFFPFSHGPRNCIGMPFAMCQLKVVLANVLRKLEFKPVEHEPILFSDLILKSANGLPVIIATR